MIMSELPARLFLVVPPGLDPETAGACITSACAAGDVACVLLRLADSEDGNGPPRPGPADEARALAVTGSAQPLGAAVVVEDSVDLCRRAGADGVHVTRGPREAAAARRLLGRDMIVGGEVRGRRHEAMELGEAGIDYIAIDQRQEAGGENLLAWWAEMFVIPVVAMAPARPADMPELARRGAGFVRPPDEMWTDPQAAARVVAACMNALKETA
jgi:thiamine-phosphate pyrophosphorylase